MKRTIPTTNYGVGRGGKKIDKIIIHWFGVGTLAGADARFKKVGEQASAHYGVSDTTVYQWVDEKDTAYAAGNFAANQTGINIEHDATTTKNASEATYQTSAKLIRAIRQRHGDLPLRPHKEFKNTQCPGTLDLAKLDALARQDDSGGMGSEEALLKVIKVLEGERDYVLGRLKIVEDQAALDKKEATRVQVTLEGERDTVLKQLKIVDDKLARCHTDLETCDTKPPVIKEVIVEKVVVKPAEELSFWQLLSLIFTRKGN